MLRRTGAGIGASALGLVTSVSAARPADDELEAIFEAPQIEALLDEAGEPTVNRDEAETLVVELAEGSVLRSTAVPTAVGKLVFARYDDGEVAEALLLLEDDPHNPYRGQLNRRDGESGPGPTDVWPVGTTGFLTVEDGGVRFVRDAHPRELAELARLVDANPAEIDALVDTKSGVYRVVAAEDGADPSAEIDGSVAVVDLEAETVRNVDAPSPDDVSIRDHNRDYCLYQFGACLWSLALPSGCSYCGTLCRASRIASWAGYVACFVCLSHVCGIRWLWNASGCYDAARCIDHWNIV